MRLVAVSALILALTGSFAFAQRPPTASIRFKSEAEAQSHCGGQDRVVWYNTRSKVYHYSGSQHYGKGKRGVYMCQSNADRAGGHASKAKGH